MKDNFSRRNFINKAGSVVMGVGAAMALPAIANAIEEPTMAGEKKVRLMADGTEYDAAGLGKSLAGIGFNLLVTDVTAAVEFAEKILLAKAMRADKVFAMMQHGSFRWMYHLDASYATNAFSASVKNVKRRGSGVELRLYDVDPDAAEKRARDNGYEVLIPTTNKPHGLRECTIIAPDGYAWAISRDLREGEKG